MNEEYFAENFLFFLEKINVFENINFSETLTFLTRFLNSCAETFLYVNVF